MSYPFPLAGEGGDRLLQPNHQLFCCFWILIYLRAFFLFLPLSLTLSRKGRGEFAGGAMVFSLNKTRRRVAVLFYKLFSGLEITPNKFRHRGKQMGSERLNTMFIVWIEHLLKVSFFGAL